MKITAISTCWRAEQISDPKELVNAMKKTGINQLELEFRISQESYEKIKKNYAAWGVRIVSMHAVCPAPAGRKRGAELFLISDEKKENRILGVEHIKQTLRNAAEVGAKAIIVHCGRLSVPEPIDVMKKIYDRGKIHTGEAKKALQGISQVRRANREKSFQALLRSLDGINAEAEKYSINVGLENRYYFFELPDMEELNDIFNRFEGGKLGYWHDTGHAQAQENLFGAQQKDMLEVFSHRLIGVHFHDVQRGYFDHYEPGCGMVDFDMVKPYLKGNTIRVLEINQKVNEAGAKRGIAFLREKGIF